MSRFLKTGHFILTIYISIVLAFYLRVLFEPLFNGLVFIYIMFGNSLTTRSIISINVEVSNFDLALTSGPLIPNPN